MDVQGGISRVMGVIKCHLPDHIRVRQIATFTAYTGIEVTQPSDRGKRIAQAFVLLWALVQILFFALSHRTVFHVHFAVKGSLPARG